MITVFYCTRQSNSEYSKRISETSGLKDVEIIEYVNDGTVSLAKAYNTCLNSAKYDNIIFIHDDLVFSPNWGKKILSYLNDSDYGIIGIAGTTTLNKSGVWWENKFEMVGRVWHQQIQTMGSKTKKTNYESKYSEKFPDQILPVVTVDGLFIAVNKRRVVEPFDERFEGFHFYDIPFCVNNLTKGVKVGVVTDIKITHKSIGKVNDSWHKNRLIFQELYKNQLPLSIQPHNLINCFEQIGIVECPSIALIIPSKNNLTLLESCIKSIDTLTQDSIKKQLTIYVADTGSDNANEIEQHIKNILGNSLISFKFVKYNFYNFAVINNQMVLNHLNNEELLVFCNDDIEFVNDVLSFMVNAYLKNKKKVGTIGARLHYPNGRIQHGGVMLYQLQNGTFTVGHKGIYSSYGGKYSTEKVFANTGALLMIQHELFNKLGKFYLTDDCFEDIILSISAILRKKDNLYVGEATAIHHESVSRKKEADYNEKINKNLNKFLIPIISKYKKFLTAYFTKV